MFPQARIVVLGSLLVCLVTSFGLICHAAESGSALEQGFRQPPQSAKPWVYWFWMNGNITRDGITADLEGMHDAGIGGCLIMHVRLGKIGQHDLGRMPPDGPITFMSGEFRELFHHAVAEADRLGMQIDMNNADGFTGSGGPWVPVEKSMKKLVWTETHVVGGRNVAVRLPQPETVLDYYRDIAVVAFPCQSSLHEQMQSANPVFSAPDTEFKAAVVSDGDPKTRTAIWRGGLTGQPQLLISFPEPYAADTLVLEQTSVVRGAPAATLESSQDGKNFRPIGPVSLKWYPAASTNTVRFDACVARYYRLSFHRNSQLITVGDVALGRSNRVHYWEPKAGFTRYGEWGGGAQLYRDRKTTVSGNTAAIDSPLPAGDLPAIAVSEVVNLTDAMSRDGQLSWPAPPGEWTVLRIGYTSTGIKNHPASEGGHGLECDKLHPSGAEAAFHGMLDKLIADSGDLIGRSFTHAHIDSWEVGIQNWTEGMADAFRQRNGYDLTPFYPLIVAGHAVGSNDLSERFLWDLRQTLLEMMAENYLGRIQSLCHTHGLSFSSEAAGRQTFLHNPIYLLSKSDLPMGEFWPHEGTPRVDGKAAASVAHLYDKSVVGAEAFTGALGFAAWQSHPFRLKGIGDEAFCLGINQFVIHYCVHQAYEGFRPGFAMGPWGIHLDRMNTWWDQSSPWFTYLARCQHMLRQGNFVADVLYFPGEGAPHHLGKRENLSVPLPKGYDFDGCDRETLLKRLAVREGRLVLPHAVSYQYLMLPDETTMTPQLARRVGALVEAGASVIGPRPERSPSLQGYPDCDQQTCDVAQNLWDRDRVVWGKTFDEIAEADGLRPDFEYTSTSAEADIRYIHRRAEESDIYFVSNRQDSMIDIVATFRVAGKQPELWHPETGVIRDLPDWKLTQDQRSRIPLEFQPAESVFIVFRRPAAPLPTTTGNFLRLESVAEILGPWTVEFPLTRDASVSMEFTELASWTLQKDFDIKHFSGTATYRKVFEMPAGVRTSDADSRMFLDLGDVQVIAQLKLNGREIGILWKPPFRAEITAALAAGRNELEIRVTNLWPNRLIGDEHFPVNARWEGQYLQAWPDWFLQGKPRPEPRRKAFTVVKHYDKDSPLLPSGLLGPVTIQAVADTN